MISEDPFKSLKPPFEITNNMITSLAEIFRVGRKTDFGFKWQVTGLDNQKHIVYL